MDMNETTKYLDFLKDDTFSMRPEVLECLINGLGFLKADAEAPVQKLANRILANIIIEQLDISGFGIYRKASFPELVLEQENAC